MDGRLHGKPHPLIRRVFQDAHHLAGNGRVPNLERDLLPERSAGDIERPRQGLVNHRHLSLAGDIGIRQPASLCDAVSGGVQQTSVVSARHRRRGLFGAVGNGANLGGHARIGDGVEVRLGGLKGQGVVHPKSETRR